MGSVIIHDFLEFEDIVGRVLRAGGLDVANPPLPREMAPDFLATRNGTAWAIEVKYYRSAQAQYGLLVQAARQVAAAAVSTDAQRSALIVSCEVAPAVRERLAADTGVAVADQRDVFTWALAVAPETVDRLTALTTPDPDAALHGRGRSLSEFFETEPPPLPSPRPEPSSEGHRLCEAIRLLPRGGATWRQYEERCCDALRYLFGDSLLVWAEQRTTEDSLSRFDLICRATASCEFWRFCIDHLNSRYVVFEFKNYTDALRQTEILTTEKYLFERGLRSIAIILTRVGATAQATHMISGAMRESGKLMLVLNDDDVCEMLHMKDRGEDATDYLFAKTDEFLTRLAR